MKKIQKSIIMIFMSVTLLLNSGMPVSAYYETQGDNSSNSRIDFAATLTIISYKTGKSAISSLNGHALLVVKNISSQAITVGRKSVPRGGSVTVGTFGNRKSHKGVWYNIESYNSPALKDAVGRVGLRTSLTGSQLGTLNKKIRANDKWTNTKNCSWFAASVWNSVASSSYKVSAGTPATPAKLCESIKKKKGYISKPSVVKQKIGTICYWNVKKGKMIYDKRGADKFNK